MSAALSIRQPWAWLIAHGFKDIENRDWKTNFRGELFIHASKTMTVADYDAAVMFVDLFIGPELVQKIPAMSDLQRGGLVGIVEVVDCVQRSSSPWFTGSGEDDGAFGFVLEDAQALPFMPWKGRLGFFNVPFGGKSC
jgi:hypothetical protein